FFKAQDLADALVRESIQNSLDARRGRSAVRVRFSFASMYADAVRPYLEGLDAHLQAASKTMHAILPRAAEDVPCLLIEDYGTRGLTGDPQIDPELEPSPDEGK